MRIKIGFLAILLSYNQGSLSACELDLDLGVYVLAGQQVVPIPKTHFIWSVGVEKESDGLEFNEIWLAPLEIKTERSSDKRSSEAVPDGIIIREVMGLNGKFDWQRKRELGKAGQTKSMEYEGGIMTVVSHPGFQGPIKAVFESGMVQIVVSGGDVVCRLKSIVKNRKPLEFLGQ